MKTVTFSADESLIREAEEHARARQTTLEEEFRRWLAEYAERSERTGKVAALLNELSYVDTGGRKFTRDEMNER